MRRPRRVKRALRLKDRQRRPAGGDRRTGQADRRRTGVQAEPETSQAPLRLWTGSRLRQSLQKDRRQ